MPGRGAPRGRLEPSQHSWSTPRKHGWGAALHGWSPIPSLNIWRGSPRNTGGSPLNICGPQHSWEGTQHPAGGGSPSTAGRSPQLLWPTWGLEQGWGAEGCGQLGAGSVGLNPWELLPARRAWGEPGLICIEGAGGRGGWQRSDKGCNCLGCAQNISCASQIFTQGKTKS